MPVYLWGKAAQLFPVHGSQPNSMLKSLFKQCLMVSHLVVGWLQAVVLLFLVDLGELREAGDLAAVNGGVLDIRATAWNFVRYLVEHRSEVRTHFLSPKLRRSVADEIVVAAPWVHQQLSVRHLFYKSRPITWYARCGQGGGQSEQRLRVLALLVSLLELLRLLALEFKNLFLVLFCDLKAFISGFLQNVLVMLFFVQRYIWPIHDFLELKTTPTQMLWLQPGKLPACNNSCAVFSFSFRSGWV